LQRLRRLDATNFVPEWGDPASLVVGGLCERKVLEAQGEVTSLLSIRQNCLDSGRTRKTTG